MIQLENCYKLGQIQKTHGVDGQMVLKLEHVQIDNIKKMEWVFFIIEGLPVPFFVLEWSERAPDGVLLSIEDITTVELAKRYKGTTIYIDKKSISKQSHTMEIEATIGFKLIETIAGEIGVLEEIMDLNSNRLMRCMQGKKETLIPLQDEFITKIDGRKKIVYLALPEGLLDL